MIKGYNEKVKSNLEIKKLLHDSAIAYSSVCEKSILFIYRKNSENAEYHYYETYYEKRNFIHLVGCKSNEHIDAEKFYEKCLETCEIPDEYITYKESRIVASSKLSIFKSLFEFKSVKMYKMGKHDKINIKNNFQMGLGNSSSNGVLGYTKYGRLPIPTTVLVNSLSEYSTSEGNVLATLCKYSTKYDTVIGCVKSGLKVEDLPKNIQDKIHFPNGIIK